ncbi:MAG: hypothetical protein KGO49_14825 [Gammaproteobacteria bacterium]|nr:hypothetical protein [Gammaproteobacteria bacterium]
MNRLKILSQLLVNLISVWLVSSCSFHQNSPFDEDKSCIKTDLPSVENKDNGFVVTQHETICKDQGRVFVFLHKENEKDDPSNMIFVYSEIAELGKSPYPIVSWIDHDTMEISVSRIDSIYKNKRTLNNVKIIYYIGHLDSPDLFYALNHPSENASTPEKIRARDDFNRRFSHSDDFPDLEIFFKEDWSKVRKSSFLDLFY